LHRDLAAMSWECIVAVAPGTGPVGEFCAALDQLRIEPGADVPLLAKQLGLSRTQLYAILAGTIRRPPDWDRVVRPLVDACTRGDPRAVAAWRQRHAVLTGVWEELRRRDRLPQLPARPARPGRRPARCRGSCPRRSRASPAAVLSWPR
jgi:hypothetical protein